MRSGGCSPRLSSPPRRIILIAQPALHKTSLKKTLDGRCSGIPEAPSASQTDKIVFVSTKSQVEEVLDDGIHKKEISQDGKKEEKKGKRERKKKERKKKKERRKAN